MIVDPWFYAVAIPAVILVGLSKGGFAGIGAMSLPLLALQISPLRGAVIMLPILMIQDVVSVWAYWRKWDWSNLKVLLPGAMAGIAAGYLLAAYVSDAAFKLALGIVSLVFGARYLLSVAPAVPKPASPRAGLFWGAMSGFTSMIANIGGPPFQIYVMPQRLPHDVFIGTMTLFFAIVNWVKVPPFIALGLFTRETLLTSVVLFPIAIAATWSGVLLVRRVSADDFTRIIYGLMMLLGAKLIWDGAAGLWMPR
ncbi:MAG: uncharacterized protein QOD94_2425 [Alphaproteobacteria bacterium]|jgi:uncharacterized membrane protein YfcA|nr:uncharacterized protein [Alphaproteobacteria bacterium]